MDSRAVLFAIFVGLTATGAVLVSVGMVLNDDVFWLVTDTYSIVILTASAAVFGVALVMRRSA